MIFYKELKSFIPLSLSSNSFSFLELFPRKMDVPTSLLIRSIALCMSIYSFQKTENPSCNSFDRGTWSNTMCIFYILCFACRLKFRSNRETLDDFSRLAGMFWVVQGIWGIFISTECYDQGSSVMILSFSQVLLEICNIYTDDYTGEDREEHDQQFNIRFRTGNFV